MAHTVQDSCYYVLFCFIVASELVDTELLQDNVEVDESLFQDMDDLQI